MTAEIAIMNKEAIALAADSAVTMSQESGQKVFTSANKLFTLSKFYPVGMMVYGSASFMGVPWETIIKIYRNKLGKRKFGTLNKYADDFIAFLDNGNPLFPEDQQKKYLYGSTFSYFTLIREEIEKKVKSIVEKEGKIEIDQIEEITSDAIKEHYDKLQKTKMLQSIPTNYIENIINKYGDIIDKAKEKIFEKLPVSTGSLNKLRKIAASLFSKDIFQSNISGVVIAGFGEKDTFPSLKSFDIEGIVNNKLKYRRRESLSVEIGFENNATIIPFAQREMVAAFMTGIDPYLQDQIEGYLSEIFDKYPEIIVENIEKFDYNEKKMLKEKLKKLSNNIFKKYQEDIETYRTKSYVDPVIRVVAMLPKDELAVMAETLVSLTSFKRKVTMDETVGGPIDVAVISKGDGLVWIKRKHYFRSELNPQFFANYYREVKDGKK
ncbi:MAG: hypothetical protein ISS81_05045 [Candidatus Marinimicrobia bacterium]|nr:hypothetical protein [Candidatus Neomarinimicrobiota bacterium]